MSFIVNTQWPLSLELEILMQMLAAKSLEGGGEGPREETTPLIATVSHFYSVVLVFLTHKVGEIPPSPYVSGGMKMI